MKRKASILFFVILLLGMSVCGCSTDDIQGKLESLASFVSEDDGITGSWTITEIVSGERTISPDKLDTFIDPEGIAIKIAIHDDNTATITNGMGEVEKQICTWEIEDDELTFWGDTQYESEGNIIGESSLAIMMVTDDYCEWELEDGKLIYHDYSSDASTTITYEKE